MGGSLLNHSLVFKDWLLVNYTLSLKLSAIKQKREGQKLKKEFLVIVGVINMTRFTNFS